VMQELKEDRETPQRRVFISYFHRKFQPKKRSVGV